MCKQSHGSILSIEELAKDRRGLRSLRRDQGRLTGGEPSVRRGLLELCRMLRQLPGLRELCITTNASLLPAMAGALREAGWTG